LKAIPKLKRYGLSYALQSDRPRFEAFALQHRQYCLSWGRGDGPSALLGHLHEQIQLVDARPVIVQTGGTKRFSPDPGGAEPAIAAKDQGDPAQQPMQPTGAMIPLEQLRSLRWRWSETCW
jgi:hypothetical protein